jgi:hypothetical protein
MPVNWSEEQRRVISAAPTARIMVDAGPGTGKTAVACGRIAHLIAGGIPASRIWLVSFTRTAVRELRDRLPDYAEDPGEMLGIRIATLDSHAWALQSGFDQEATLLGDFDNSVEAATQLLHRNPDVAEYMRGIRHVVIDEAQDILGVRRDFCAAIIASLPKEAGVTVFFDEAQSIYGFAGEDGPDGGGKTLPEHIRNTATPPFDEYELTQVFRTNDATLHTIFRRGRSLLREHAPAAQKLTDVRALVTGVNHEAIASHRADLQHFAGQDIPESTFFLFRRRGEALEAASYLAAKPHRLRLSGFPTCLHAWLALVFWDWNSKSDNLRLTEFDTRWKQRVEPFIQDGRACWDQESAWRAMIRFAGVRGRGLPAVDVLKLRKVLSKAPPADFCESDFGLKGPAIGTIHSAKGREAMHVRLYLPVGHFGDEEEAVAEEARIVFVGASRAQERLAVGLGARMLIPKNLDSGRAMTHHWRGNPRKAQVEIGRSGDIDHLGLVGTSFYTEQQHAEAAQRACADTVGAVRKATGSRKKYEGAQPTPWTYDITLSDAETAVRICALSEQVNRDLFAVAGKVGAIPPRPPRSLLHLRTLGARTLVVDDVSALESLHKPWRDSGFMLAPCLVGYGMCYF